MFQQKVTLSDNVKECLNQVINACPHDKLFVLADEYTARLCLPLIQNQEYLDKAECIIIGATDTNKTLDSLSYVWKEFKILQIEKKYVDERTCRFSQCFSYGNKSL